MLDNLLLTDEEKKHFMRALYSIMMVDRQITDKENDTIMVLANEIFKINGFERIDLSDDQLIVEEINKINKLIPTIYLFNILSDLGKFIDDSNLNQQYYKRLYGILKNTRDYEKIVKNKIISNNFKDFNSNLAPKKNGLANKVKDILFNLSFD